MRRPQSKDGSDASAAAIHAIAVTSRRTSVPGRHRPLSRCGWPG